MTAIYTVYIIFLVSIFIGSYFYIFKPYLDAKTEVALIKEKLKELKVEPDISKRISQFNKWVEENSQSHFMKKFVQPSWSNHYDKYMQFQQSGLPFTPDVYDFFLEDTLNQKFGKRKLVEAIPGAFLALGIVGTFLGIAIGVAGLNTTGDADAMKDGIQILLGGMKVKFASSIVGILLSLFWQLIDKTFMYPKLSESFHDLRQNLDMTFPTQEQNNVLSQMLINQEKQMVEFQTFVTELMIPNMLSGISEVLSQNLKPQYEQSLAMERNIMDSLKQQTMDNQTFINNEMLPAMITGVSDTFKPQIEQTQTMERNLIESMQQQTTSIHEIMAPQLEQARLLEANLLETLQQQHQETQALTKEWVIPEMVSGIAATIDQSLTPQLEQARLLEANLLETLKQQHQETQVLTKEWMVPEMVSGIAATIDQSLTPHLQQTQTLVQDMLESVTQNQVEGINAMVDSFVTSLHEITGDHMKELGEALSATVEWQQRVHKEMSALVQSMQDSAKEQSLMVEKTTSLTEEINVYTEKITDYHTVMENSITLLNETTEKNSSLQTSISELLETMTEERIIFHEHFNEHLQHLKENVSSITYQTGQQLKLNEKLESNLEKYNSLSESQQDLSKSLAEQASLTKDANEKTNGLLKSLNDAGTKQHELQKELNAALQVIMNEKTNVGKMVQNINGNLITQLGDMDKRIEHLRKVWESTSQVFTTVNKQLAVSMNKFTDDMHRGLEHTFEQFDAELSKSVSYLSKAVGAIHEGVSDLPDAVDSLKTTVTELNKHAKTMINSI